MSTFGVQLQNSCKELFFTANEFCRESIKNGIGFEDEKFSLGVAIATLASSPYNTVSLKGDEWVRACKRFYALFKHEVLLSDPNPTTEKIRAFLQAGASLLSSHDEAVHLPEMEKGLSYRLQDQIADDFLDRAYNDMMRDLVCQDVMTIDEKWQYLSVIFSSITQPGHDQDPNGEDFQNVMSDHSEGAFVSNQILTAAADDLIDKVVNMVSFAFDRRIVFQNGPTGEYFSFFKAEDTLGSLYQSASNDPSDSWREMLDQFCSRFESEVLSLNPNPTSQEMNKYIGDAIKLIHNPTERYYYLDKSYINSVISQDIATCFVSGVFNRMIWQLVNQPLESIQEDLLVSKANYIAEVFPWITPEEIRTRIGQALNGWPGAPAA